ncbi:MAG: glutamate-5-semialdehyde dehydrogenase, partial [Actinobacteria bacterium]|nr:glutamate-5-semialdehyde dehydrogenase [Actinomycetota bacterium]
MTDAFQQILDNAREASIVLAQTSTTVKNRALGAIADALVSNSDRIVAANTTDVARERADGMAEGLLDRLELTPERVVGLANAVRDIVSLPDPIGEVLGGSTLPNGLHLTQVRVPFGVVGSIYEARPNVTVDLAAILLKSGNVAILRGGSAAENSNTVLVDVIGTALENCGLPRTAVQTIDSFGRDGANRLMNARGFVDVLVPRGSASLISAVVNDSSVPVIETGAGVVHIFLDASAELEMSSDIVHNAKTQRVGVCNALETLLVHRDAASRLIPSILNRLVDSDVKIHADDAARAIFPHAEPATPEDWGHEYLSLDLAVKIVDSLQDAIDHIGVHSTHHTDA